MSGSPDYQEFLVYKRPPGFEFNFPADKKFVWVKADPQHKAYSVAEVLDDSDDSVVVVRMTDTAEERIVDKEEAHGLNPSKFDGVDDCAQLGYLSEAAVLYNLKIRYEAKIIYTYSGLFCVAINPYQFFPIYTDEMIKTFTGKRREELAPHVYAVADESYRNLLSDKKNQSMLVTGESGAGKTENTKKIIQYLAAIAGRSGSEGKLEQQLLQCNPLLEALGNAKTLKNDNSSRFGKFIKITFGSSGFISGGSIVSYLLEKNRVVKQGRDERSFHIFYQLCEALPADKKAALHLTGPDDFKFLNQSGCVRVPSVNDSKDFEDTRSALKTLNFSAEETDTLYRTVAAVMHLGNIEFSGDEQAEISNPATLDIVAELLQIDAPALAQGLVRPRILAGRDLVARSLNPHQASNSRDALAKALYGRCFLWVVDKINQSLQVVAKDNFIGILDIAGFEIFEFNSFEQLCINFTNERLQQFLTSSSRSTSVKRSSGR
jgi:myosin protein heavy chain